MHAPGSNQIRVVCSAYLNAETVPDGHTAEDLHEQAGMLAHLLTDAIVQPSDQKAATREAWASSMSRDRR